MAAGTKESRREVADLRERVGRLEARIRTLEGRVVNGANGATPPLPEYPAADAEGNRPAREYVHVSIAREVIRRRRAAGWTQGELARRAGVRQETVCRVESGRHPPSVRTVDKIDRALRRAGV